MSELQPSNISHENMATVVSPESISDGRLGGLLAAVGNHEAKAVSYLMLEPGKEYGRAELTTALRAVNDQEKYHVRSGNIYSYLGYSFEPVGLLVKHVLIDGTVRYIKEREEPIPTALAGYLAQFSLTHPKLNLNKIFSDTQSRSAERTEGLRSPLRRLQILEYIVSATGELNYADLKRFIGEKAAVPTITPHLLGLQEAGLVTYIKEHTSNRPLNIVMTEPIEAVKPISRFTKLTAQVVELLNDSLERDPSGVLNINRQQILGRLAEVRNSPVSKKPLTDAVRVILVGLADEKKITLRDTEPKSEFSVSDEQRAIIHTLVRDIKAIQSGDTETIERCQEYAKDILENKQAVSTLFQKAFERSTKVDMIGKEKMASLVLSVLEQEGSISVDEIRLKLGRKVGKRVVAAAVTQLSKNSQLESRPSPDAPSTLLWSVASND